VHGIRTEAANIDAERGVVHDVSIEAVVVPHLLPKGRHAMSEQPHVVADEMKANVKCDSATCTKLEQSLFLQQ